MCYLCNCFGWALDMVQSTENLKIGDGKIYYATSDEVRLKDQDFVTLPYQEHLDHGQRFIGGWKIFITFFLACVLCFVVTLGLVVAVAAGIAYGYNYSMAEFLTFSKQDITVFMRRGQFYDKPDVDLDRQIGRRSMESEDSFLMNKTSDYQDYQDPNMRADAKRLDQLWGQINDVRKYAQELTKYSGETKPTPKEQAEDIVFTPPVSTTPSRTPWIGISPNGDLFITSLMRNGASQIVKRKLQPLEFVAARTRSTKEIPDLYDGSEDTEVASKPPSDVKVVSGERPSRLPYIQMPPFPTTLKMLGADYPEDLDDEENVIYKPV